MFQVFFRSLDRVLLATWVLATAILVRAEPSYALEVIVQSSEELAGVLSNPDLAKGTSKTIRLLPGSYKEVSIKGISGPLRLTAADPQDMPRLSRLTVVDSTNVMFDRIVFDLSFYPDRNEPLWKTPFRLGNSQEVTFSNVLFDGDIYPSASPVDNGFPGGRALVAQEMRGLRIIDSEIRNFWTGVTIFRSDDVVFKGNDVHSMRKDGINLAQVQNVLIEGNIFHDFDRSANSDDHSDFLQLFSTNTEKPSVGVSVRNNIFNSGHGLFTQSIFFRNELVDKGLAGEDMFYRDLLFENNVIVNAHLHGISIGETDGLIIRNNTLIRNRLSEGKGFSDELASPRIRVAPSSRNVRVEGNLAYWFPRPQGADWKVTNNLVIQDDGRGKPGYYGLVFENAQNGDPQNLASFRYRWDGPAAGRGIGAPQLEPEK